MNLRSIFKPLAVCLLVTVVTGCSERKPAGAQDTGTSAEDGEGSADSEPDAENRTEAQVDGESSEKQLTE